MFERNNNYSLSCWTYICFLLIYLGKGYVILFLLLLNVQSSPYSIIMVVSFINFQTFSYIYSKMHFCPYIYQIYVLKPKCCFNSIKFCAGCRFLWSDDSNLILLWCLLCNNFDIQLCSVKYQEDLLKFNMIYKTLIYYIYLYIFTNYY